MKARNKKWLRAILLMIGFLFCVLTILYPLISNYLYDQRQDMIITEYEEVVKEMDASELNTEREQCLEYNRRLAEKSQVYTGDEMKNVQFDRAFGVNEEEYFDRMNIGGSAVMGYVKIPKINVYLSVYHGTGENVLQKGLGHLKESSLPIGGESTHAVITGHSGTTNKALFTDLNQLEQGDYFFLSVLGQVLAYQVDQIEVVLPYEVESLEIQEGKDYVTLLTCTPYGINTHRLLVRGTRVELTDARLSLFDGGSEVLKSETLGEERESYSFSTFYRNYLNAVKSGALAACMGTALFMAVRIIRRKRRR